LIGYFRRRTLFKQIVAAGRSSALESLILEETIPLLNTRRLATGWATAVEVFVDVDIAATSGKTVVLLEAVVIMFIVTTRRTPATPHTLESIAIPTLASPPRWLVKAGEIASRRAIHGYVF
jgi:hypothetical protein